VWDGCCFCKSAETTPGPGCCETTLGPGCCKSAETTLGRRGVRGRAELAGDDIAIQGNVDAL